MSTKSEHILNCSDLTPEIRVGFETLVENIRLLCHLARCKRRQGLGRRKSFTAGGPFKGTGAKGFFPIYFQEWNLEFLILVHPELTPHIWYTELVELESPCTIAKFVTYF